MTPRQEAMQQIKALAKEHRISLEELHSALGRQEIEANKKDGFTLTRLFSYLGGIFILAGLSTFIGLSWNHLNTFSRIVITLGPGIACLIMGCVIARQNTGERREQNVSILFILAALFECTGLFVTIVEFSKGGGNVHLAQLLVFGVLALQYGCLFTVFKRTTLLFFTIYFGFAAFINVCELMDIPHNLTELVCGTTLLALSYGIQRTPYNSICGFGYFVSSVVLLWMGFDVVRGSMAEMVYFGFACFMLYISTLVRSKSILATSTVAIFAYISYFTGKHFVDSMGWPLCLILLGVIFFGISNLALKLNKRLEM